MNKQIHYSIKNLNKENANFNLIIGEKSNGKSYQIKNVEGIEHYLGINEKKTKEELLKEAWKEHHRFILLRRWREDISPLWVEQYFADVDVLKATEGEYNTVSYYRKVLFFANYDAESKKIIRGEKIRLCNVIINRTAYVISFFFGL